MLITEKFVAEAKDGVLSITPAGVKELKSLTDKLTREIIKYKPNVRFEDLSEEIPEILIKHLGSSVEALLYLYPNQNNLKDLAEFYLGDDKRMLN